MRPIPSLKPLFFYIFGAKITNDSSHVRLRGTPLKLYSFAALEARAAAINLSPKKGFGMVEANRRTDALALGSYSYFYRLGCGRSGCGMVKRDGPAGYHKYIFVSYCIYFADADVILTLGFEARFTHCQKTD